MKSQTATRRLLLATGALVASLLLGACAPDPTGATSIDVGLLDDGITVSVADVAAGSITFAAANQSTDFVHEIEIFGDATSGVVLPVNKGVAVVTDLTLIDEVEDILPGSSAAVTVSLEPGTYLIMCNLPAHYGNGMWAYLTVTG